MSQLLASPEKIAVLQQAQRVWAVASVHGEARKLARLHGAIAERFLPGDRLVYLGNLLGRGGDPVGAVDQVLAFRRAVIGTHGMFAGDVALLRGAQEEMWQKLLQLQFAPDPAHVLAWMLDHGAGATLAAYGGCAADGLSAARAGAHACARWTAALRDAVHARPGHYHLLSALRRAAVTEPGLSGGAPLLFVSAGLDVARPLEAQKDSFWWPSPDFDRIAAPYGTFARIVRGFDSRAAGMTEGPYTLSVDAGAGRGGTLLSVCLNADGEVVDTFEA